MGWEGEMLEVWNLLQVC